jgi:hypothetical protein
MKTFNAQIRNGGQSRRQFLKAATAGLAGGLMTWNFGNAFSLNTAVLGRMQRVATRLFITLHPMDMRTTMQNAHRALLSIGTTGELRFDGSMYVRSFGTLLLDFFATGSQAFSGGGVATCRTPRPGLELASGDTEPWGTANRGGATHDSEAGMTFLKKSPWMLSSGLCGMLLAAGCASQASHKWLTFFFDGVMIQGAMTEEALEMAVGMAKERAAKDL